MKTNHLVEEIKAYDGAIKKVDKQYLDKDQQIID